MAAVLRRSPAKRRGQSTQITPGDLAMLHHAGTTQSPSARPRRKSDTSVVPTIFQLWTPTVPLPNVESSHIFDELVKSEAIYVEELKSIYSTIIRPCRLLNDHTNILPLSPTKLGSPQLNSSKPARLKKHGRSGSLFSLKSEKEPPSSPSSDPLALRLKDPMEPEADHLERAFRSIETMVRSHSGMLSAFYDARNPYELMSAFIVHVESLQLVYRSFVLTLPYISTLLPLANDLLPNKLSGYSRFLGPMQRSIKYELLTRRLSNALYEEAGSLELQKLVRTALKTAERFCQNLEAAQKSEQARIHLAELSTRLGTDVKHKTLLFQGPISTEALSSKKGCKINYAILFTDGTVFWNTSGSEQERTPKTWTQESVTNVEDGGYLDLVVHTILQKQGKRKAIRRAVGFTTVARPLSVATPDTSPDKSRKAFTPLTEIVDAKGEKRRRKESIIEEWVQLGRQKEKEQKRFSLGSTADTVAVLTPDRPEKDKNGYF